MPAPSELECWPGKPFPLGALWDGSGTNFSVFSEHELTLTSVATSLRLATHDDVSLADGAVHLPPLAGALVA